VRRRELIVLIGGAVSLHPVAVPAEQKAVPVIGFLSSLSASDQTKITAAFRQGLHDAGYVEGQNVVIEYRWAEAQYNRLPAMAAELVRRQVAVIAAISGTPAVLAAKAATATIPIVFAVGADPVAVGLVTSLNRPGGNVTGATFFASELTEKRLELLRELVPKATIIAQFENTANPNSARSQRAYRLRRRWWASKSRSVVSPPKATSMLLLRPLCNTRSMRFTSALIPSSSISATRSSRWRRAPLCRRFTQSARLSKPVA
jgi:putative ABC transport system substrate-binding protein